MIYSKENLERYAKECDTISDLVRKLRNSDTVSAGSLSYVSKKLKQYGVDTSHFVGSAKSIKNLEKRSRDFRDVLVFNENLTSRVGRATLLNAIKNEGSLEYICASCGNDGFYNGKPLKLHIDHIDGNWKNNLISNLRFLCPNCHSQTLTFGFCGLVKY